MKQHFTIIFMILSFFEIQAETKKTITIKICATKSKTHRFIMPLVTATECAISLYALIPILLASLGNIQLCLPAKAEITVEKIRDRPIVD